MAAYQRWNGYQIYKFLDIYEKHELLWNPRVPGFHKKHKRELAMKKLAEEVADKGLGRLNVDQLFKKIRSLRAVYRSELSKVLKSRGGAGGVYTPHLMWFKKAHKFLYSVKKVKVGDNTEDSLQEELNDNVDEEEKDNSQEETMSNDSDPNRGQDEFDVFAGYLAAQLRQLPVENASKVEKEIRRLIKEKRIKEDNSRIEITEVNCKIENK